MVKNLNEDIVSLLFELYENKSIIDLDEFREDVMRFTYVYRILEKYKNGAQLNLNLLLNHLVILFNCFGSDTIHILLSNNTHLYAEVCTLLYFVERLPKELEYAVIQSMIAEMETIIEIKNAEL